ncbi:MAG TPA: SurA N-terminal domain-containing protein [Labilithrix sp.]|nr:SurA N-terminal domain-containing protein [Labilithrix sp.]
MRRPTALLATLALTAFASQAGVAQAEEKAAARAPVPLDGIVAIVDDVVLFRSDVAERVRHFEPQLPKDPQKRRAELGELSRVMVKRLVEEVLIAKDAKRLLIEVTDAEVSSGIATVAAQNKVTRAELDAEVAKAGFTPASYAEEVRRQVLEQKWLVLRAVDKIDRKKAGDAAAFQRVIEKQRELLLADLRRRTYIEIR